MSYRIFARSNSPYIYAGWLMIEDWTLANNRAEGTLFPSFKLAVSCIAMLDDTNWVEVRIVEDQQ